MKKLYLIVFILIISSSSAQDTITIHNFNVKKEDVIKKINAKRYEDIYELKMNQCNFIHLNANIDRFTSNLIVDKKKVYLDKIGIRKVSFLHLKYNDSISEKKSYVIYRRDYSLVFSKDTLKLSLVKHNKFYFAFDRLSYDDIKSTLDKKGYHPYRIELFTYSSFWNKFLHNFGLIKDMTYYERLKCIDFEELAKKLD
jgi:hypothetical protein